MQEARRHFREKLRGRFRQAPEEFLDDPALQAIIDSIRPALLENIIQKIFEQISYDLTRRRLTELAVEGRASRVRTAPPLYIQIL